MKTLASCGSEEEVNMCYDRDWQWYEERRKAEEARSKQQRRIDQLLSQAGEQSETPKPEGTPAKEVAPAK